MSSVPLLLGIVNNIADVIKHMDITNAVVNLSHDNKFIVSYLVEDSRFESITHITVHKTQRSPKIRAPTPTPKTLTMFEYPGLHESVASVSSRQFGSLKRFV